MNNAGGAIIDFAIPNTNKRILANDNFKITDSVKSEIKQTKQQTRALAIKNKEMVQAISSAMSKDIADNMLTNAKIGEQLVPVAIDIVSIDKAIQAYPNGNNKFGSLTKTKEAIDKIKADVKLKLRDTLVEKIAAGKITNDQIRTILPVRNLIK